MKLKSFIIALLVAGSAFAGHEVLNGGDVVHCPSTGTQYSLDYILAKELFPNVPLANSQSTSESLMRISELIQNKFPYWADDFKQFIAGIDNTSNFSKPYVWKDGPFELDDIVDEESTRIPGWCALGGIGVPHFSQIVIRNDLSTPRKVKIIYNYDGGLMAALGGTQKSFVYVHEWLWNVSKNVRNNRKLNYLLHTNYFDQMSTTEVESVLQALGFNVK